MNHPIPGLADALTLARLVDPFDKAAIARIAASGHPTAHGGTAALKERLKDLETKIDQARGEKAALGRKLETARAAFANANGADTKSPQFIAAKSLSDEFTVKSGELAELEEARAAVLQALGENPTPSAGATPPADAAPWAAGADRILASEDARSAINRMATSSQPLGPVSLGEVASRETLAATTRSFGAGASASTIITSDAMRRSENLLVPQLRRITSILGLIPTATTESRTVPYTQEGGSFATATEVAEGDAKPEAAISFTDAEADVATIAHWSKISKQSLADVPALRATLASRLTYGVLRRLEGQVLAGNGSGANLAGILNTSGIGTVAYDADELAADQILAGITNVELAEAQPDAIVLNPADVRDIVKVKASGDGHYYSGGPFAMTPREMWGVPVVPSATIPVGTALVGAFAVGAELFIREGVHVLLSDSDQDDFTRNKVTLLGEMRAALAVWRPAAFCVVDIAA